MKLLTFEVGVGSKLGALLGDRIVDLGAASAAMRASGSASEFPELPDDMLSFLALESAGMQAALKILAWLQHRADTQDQPEPEPLMHELSAVRLKAPVQDPEKIIGIGLNYLDHCREMGREPPTDIRTFGMFANAIVGPDEPIWLSHNSTKMDWEAELVAVIGRRGKYIDEDRALDHVAGYTVGNDVSARDHQTADPAVMRGKSGDTHAPTGPWIVTTDELPDPGNLPIELRVNGVVKQSSNTSQLVFSVPKLVSFLSRYFTLAPGDLIFTGTPAGVGAGWKPPQWLAPGDRIDVTIGGIGTLTNPCIAEPDADGS